jgi:hypothetical protein
MKRRHFLSSLGALAALSILPKQEEQMPVEMMRISSNGRILINTTGNVGSGTNTPSSLLVISLKSQT